MASRIARIVGGTCDQPVGAKHGSHTVYDKCRNRAAQAGTLPGGSPESALTKGNRQAYKTHSLSEKTARLRFAIPLVHLSSSTSEMS